MAIVRKKIKNNIYLYQQTSQRVAGKVKTKSKYLGPLHPRRLTLTSILGQLLGGGVVLGASAAAGKLGTAKHKDRSRPDPRSFQRDTLEQIQAKAAQSRTVAPVDRELLDLMQEFDSKNGTHAKDDAAPAQPSAPAPDASSSPSSESER